MVDDRRVPRLEAEDTITPEQFRNWVVEIAQMTKDQQEERIKSATELAGRFLKDKAPLDLIAIVMGDRNPNDYEVAGTIYMMTVPSVVAFVQRNDYNRGVAAGWLAKVALRVGSQETALGALAMAMDIMTEGFVSAELLGIVEDAVEKLRDNFLPPLLAAVAARVSSKAGKLKNRTQRKEKE